MAGQSRILQWIVLLLNLVFIYVVQAEQREYCLDEIFNPRCPIGEVIQMTAAKYGRMKLGRCSPVSFGNVGCHEDAMGIIDHACSGRETCSFNVYDKLLRTEGLKPCPKGLEMHLYADYTCIKVVDTENVPCTEQALLDTPSGYISSFAVRSKCGDRQSSWLIKSSPGQQVNISLIDFGYGKGRKGECFGHITEEGHKSNTTICRQHGQKEQHVYTSNGRNVVIEVNKRNMQADSSDFMLTYQVFGCGDLDIPEAAWYKRKGDVATIGCENKNLIWKLHCEGTEWKGEVGSCPALDVSPVREAQASSSWINVDNDFSMLILVCIGVGFVILIAICVALIIIKLRRRDPPPSTRLLDADYRKSVLEPFPPMSAHDSGHYRSLVKSRDQPGYPDPHCSSSGAASHFQLPDDNGYPPPQATDGTIRQQQQPHFSTLQYTTGQRSTASREGGAPDYFVLDKQFC